MKDGEELSISLFRIHQVSFFDYGYCYCSKNLLICADEIAPSRREDCESFFSSTFITSENLALSCKTITSRMQYTDLSFPITAVLNFCSVDYKIGYDEVRQETSYKSPINNKMYRDVTSKLILKLGGAKVDFKVYYRGKLAASCEANYPQDV